jgi:uncharacterized spore protein YtfJ
MTDEMTNDKQAEQGLAIFQDTMDEFLAAADVSVVYGEPIHHEDTVIIPASEVVCFLGFGLGSGGGTIRAEPDKPSVGSGSEVVEVGISSRPVAVRGIS